MITHHSENFNFQTNVGPILISVNPYTDVGNSLTLNSTREAAKNSEALLKVADYLFWYFQLISFSDYLFALIFKTHSR